MVAEPCAAFVGIAFQSSTPCVLHHISPGIHARYGFRRTVLQQVALKCRKSAPVLFRGTWLTLQQILYGVSKYSDRQDLSLQSIRGGLGFLERAKTLLGNDLHEPSVPTIQALLLLANSLGAQGIAGNGSMLYLKIGE
jgi:hypothetical protein